MSDTIIALPTSVASWPGVLNSSFWIPVLNSSFWICFLRTTLGIKYVRPASPYLFSEIKICKQGVYWAMLTGAAPIKEGGKNNWERIKLDVMHLQKGPSSPAWMIPEGFLELGWPFRVVQDWGQGWVSVPPSIGHGWGLPLGQGNSLCEASYSGQQSQQPVVPYWSGSHHNINCIWTHHTKRELWLWSFTKKAQFASWPYQ